MAAGQRGASGRAGRGHRARDAPSRAEQFVGVFLPSWEAGLTAARELVQQRVPLSMLRLANAQETETTLALAGAAGRGLEIGLLQRYLQLRGSGAPAA